MKRKIIRCLLAGVLAFAAVKGAADVVTRTDHFEIVSSEDDAGLIAREIEERFTVYNRLFRFEPAALPGPLRVRAFRDTEAYNSYVGSLFGAGTSGAVYLHYDKAGQRELVINRSGEDGALPYQSFLQFLRAFVPHPPAWMREGFAIYFSGLVLTNEGELSLEENLSWLTAVKAIENPPGLQAILLADTRGRPEPFPALAWSLVSFFLNSGKEEYTRSLTDSFMTLSASNTAEENAGAVMKRIEQWNNMENLTRDYRDYLDSRKTFTELIAAGQRAYAAADSAGAELAFQAALDRNPRHYAPYYYLGLLAYGAKNYALAEEYYFSSLGYGAESALIFYALGLNAAAAGSGGSAVDYLRQAAEIAPERYREKTEALIARLPSR
ncbi:MAG: hypothetical protein LBK62_03265 [Treponema sp.]|jgi:hypothetical protein|nr:hypothetical protein [Treponema sp.]